MTYKISAPSTIQADIKLPASKSISNRALIISALAEGHTWPENLSDCDDTNVMVSALTPTDNTLAATTRTIDIGAAGTAMRFLTAYFSVVPSDVILTGTARMKQRPIGILVDALRYIGADIEYMEAEGYPPLHIRGKELQGGHIDVDARVSSQFISALLMIGPVLRDGLELRMTGFISSRPYIDLTLNVMHSYGAQAEWTDVDTVSVQANAYKATPYTVESDWTAASYWYEILSLTDDYEATVNLSGLRDGSRQGDSVVRYIFSTLGVKTQFLPDGTVKLTRHLRTLPRMDYDFKNSPDLAQTLVATCGALSIPFHFKGLASLRIKESDRMEALKRELAKIGADIHIENNEMSIQAYTKAVASPQPFATYDDHRMAMAFAPLAIRYGSVCIENPEVVTKSYPDFWDDLRSAGFTVEPV
jgi:3-phosphoshikimate 1-carboxyvinyltransferase